MKRSGIRNQELEISITLFSSCYFLVANFRLFGVAHKCQMLIDKLLLNDKCKMVNI